MEELNFEKLGWEDGSIWVILIIILVLGFNDWELPNSNLLNDQLKRYAELAGSEEPQDLEDKKLQG